MSASRLGSPCLSVEADDVESSWFISTLSVCLFVSFEDYDIIARVRVLFVDSL